MNTIRYTHLINKEIAKLKRENRILKLKLKKLIKEKK